MTRLERRIVTFGVVLGLASGLVQAAPFAGSAERIVIGECRFQLLQPGVFWSDREVARTIRCWTNKANAPAGGVRIAQRESGLEPRAYNRGGCGGAGCLGIFQMHARYYPDWARRVPAWFERIVKHERWANPRWNALVAVLKARRDHGWSAWSTS